MTHEERKVPSRYDGCRWRLGAHCESCDERASAEGPYTWVHAARKRWWADHGDHEPVLLSLTALPKEDE